MKTTLIKILLASYCLLIANISVGNSGLVSADPKTNEASVSLEVENIIFPKDTTYGSITGEKSVRAGLLYDTEKKVIVWQKNMDKAYPIASLTKMMVALLAAEDVSNCKVSWTDTVFVKRSYRVSRNSKKVYRLSS